MIYQFKSDLFFAWHKHGQTRMYYLVYGEPIKCKRIRPICWRGHVKFRDEFTGWFMETEGFKVDCNINRSHEVRLDKLFDILSNSQG